MSYTLSQELSAYCEILAITEDEIDHLLFCDHPPHDYLDQIHDKTLIVDDLKWLIRDMQVQITFQKFNKLRL
jgi:hypothetical protein